MIFLNKLNMIGTNLNYLSKITSRQFVNDAKSLVLKLSNTEKLI